jgi:Tfp pilus assembly protein PilF
VGAFAPATAGASGEDPKDHLRGYQQYRARLNAALGALDAGRLAEATTSLEAMVRDNVRAFEVHLYLGNAYAAQRQFASAIGEYDAAGQLNPAWAMPRFEAAKVLSTQGDVAAAVARCREGLELEPRSYYGIYTLGVIYQRAGLQTDAAATFRRAVALNDRDPRGHANLAQALVRLGDLTGAAAEFERMIALGDQVAPAQYNLGLVALRQDDRAEAARGFRLALDADPSFAPARDALARLK